MHTMIANSFAAAGAGRLIAVDSITMQLRNWVLENVLGIVPRYSNKPLGDDIAAECRGGVWPLEQRAEVTAMAPTKLHAKIAEGITCPSCMSWWATVAIRLTTEPKGCCTARWWRDTFAIWGAAAILTRKGG